MAQPILNSLGGLKPCKQDSKGLAWKKSDVVSYCANDIAIGNYLEKRSKDYMATDFEKAASICDDATKVFEKAFSHMQTSESKIADASKRVSGNIRKSANELHGGLQRIEKVANFDRLERYVGLLERAASAMSILAELEKDGKLARIANAVKT